MADPNHDQEFNPIGTVWILAIYVLAIIGFWLYAYIEMLSGS